MTTLYNYGWTGILAVLVVFAVHKFHRPVLVWSWAFVMKHHGATKREIRDYVVKEAAKNGGDLLIELTKGNSSSSEAAPASPPAVSGPVAPARPKRPSKSANPTSPAKRACTTQKPRTAVEKSPAASPIPESRSTGRHAKPDVAEKAETDEPGGRHSTP